MTVATHHVQSTYNVPSSVLGALSAAARVILTPGPRGCVTFGFPHFTDEKPGSKRRLVPDPSLTTRKWQNPNFIAVVWSLGPIPFTRAPRHPLVKCAPLRH